MEEAGRPIAIDNFMDQLSKTSFTRIWVEIDAIEPLKPRVSIRAKGKVF